MEITAARSDLAERGARYFARALVLIWALGWIMFGLLSGVGENLGVGQTLVRAALPGSIFMATAIMACCWEATGGILLLLEGILITAYFIIDINRISVLGITFVILSTTVPTFFISFLFLSNWRRSKAYRAADSATKTSAIRTTFPEFISRTLGDN